MWIDEAQLNLETAGESAGLPTVLMIHGAGGRASLWFALADRLAAHTRVAALDLSGHGASPCKGERHTLDTYAEDILAAIQALDGGPVVLAGHSMGGALAQHLAITRPDVLCGVVLAATGARLRVLPALIEQFQSPDPAQAITMMAGAAFAPGADPALIDFYTKNLQSADPRIVVQDFRICDAFDVMAGLGSIQTPTMILCGGKDMLTPPKYSAFLHDQIPGSTLKSLPDCGHILMLEDPDAAAGHILDFLKSLS